LETIERKAQELASKKESLRKRFFMALAATCHYGFVITPGIYEFPASNPAAIQR
jgi:hypothetical protein